MGVFNYSMVESMQKIALLFPGQGTQYVGMGKDFYLHFKEAQEVFHEANEVLGFDIAALCFQGKQEELNVSAGSITFTNAVRLVYKRGIFMQEACNANHGGMVSIIGLEDEKVEQICTEIRAEGVICAANYNCPGQIVISGEKSILEKASALAKERGAKIVVPLKVDGAFHSELMSPASGKLSKELELTPVLKSNIPVVANINARYVSEPDEIKTSLSIQLNSPVRWHQSMCTLIQDGFNQFYEIGPGKSLSGLMRRIDSTQKMINIDTVETFKNLMKSI